MHRRLWSQHRLVPPLLMSLVLIGVWELLTRLDTSKVRLLPAPSEIVRAMVRDSGPLLSQHVPITLLETVIGLGIAIVLGAGLAALLDFSALLKRAVYPLLIVSQTVPLVAIAPVLILLFRFGITPKVVTVILFTFFPITVSLIDGLSATDPDLVALLRSMGARRGQIWRLIRLPAALPSFFSGLRIAATYAMSGAIIGEFITAQYGLGRYLRSSYNSGRLDGAFAAIVITAILSITMVALVRLLEHLMLPWFFAQSRRAGWDEPGIY